MNTNPSPDYNLASTPTCNSHFDKNENTKNFISILEEGGFIVQEGKFSYVDILKLCSEDKVDSCLGNNAGAPYVSCFLPPAPNQNPAPGQEPPKGYNPEDPKNYPANIDFIAPGLTYKLRPDEAIVLIGQTPPPACYFSFRSYLGFVENKPEKDYSEYITTGNDNTGLYHLIFASLGDALNNFSIQTDNTSKEAHGNPFNSSTIIISTADRNVNKKIHDALGTAGYSPNIMNDDIIPMGLVNMGLEEGKDTFMFVMRAALWDEQSIGEKYINNIEKFIKVFRITPKTPPSNLTPWPVPTPKFRETDITEYQVVANCRCDLDHLRNEIINKYKGTEYNHVDLNSNVSILDNYEAILQDRTIWGDNRDTVYFKTDTFQLTSDDDFVIVYGINHEQTGKATYSNASFYGAELYNGVVGAVSTVQFPNTAVEFFPKGYENAGYYYLYKMARKADEGNVVIIPYSTGNPNGKAYGVDNNQDVFITFRAYVDKVALVGPYIYDVVWDRAILFTKKKKI